MSALGTIDARSKINFTATMGMRNWSCGCSKCNAIGRASKVNRMNATNAEMMPIQKTVSSSLAEIENF